MGAGHSDYEHDSLSESVIGCAYKVLNTLGPGFLERVYENALIIELRKADIPFAQQVPLVVRYDGIVVGEFYADLIVGGKLLIELKAASLPADAHMAQCLNYLRATGLKTCLLLNFGQARLGIRRISL